MTEDGDQKRKSETLSEVKLIEKSENLQSFLCPMQKEVLLPSFKLKDHAYK